MSTQSTRPQFIANRNTGTELTLANNGPSLRCGRNCTRVPNKSFNFRVQSRFRPPRRPLGVGKKGWCIRTGMSDDTLFAGKQWQFYAFNFIRFHFPPSQTQTHWSWEDFTRLWCGKQNRVRVLWKDRVEPTAPLRFTWPASDHIVDRPEARWLSACVGARWRSWRHLDMRVGFCYMVNRCNRLISPRHDGKSAGGDMWAVSMTSLFHRTDPTM